MTESIARSVPQRTPPATPCTDFLSALLQGVDPQLWIELRCIHPTADVKPQVRWLPVGKAASALVMAQPRNADGYGVYFAPCPRHTRKGNAEQAAVLGALWVDLDCDGDPVQRTRAMTQLDAFALSPSVIIDSGGGWHAYWLLTEPYLLSAAVDRQRAASLLTGLCAALGGDAAYVKSVASLMRLPGLVNTKPARNGALVTITAFAPECRYPLTAFDWLAVAPKTQLPPVHHATALGPAPLPRVTTAYLSHGADRYRNNALFDAACQFRDAGYPQQEAEAQLVPRYIADGDGEPGRERTARATVASAYQRPARDPLPTGRAGPAASEPSRPDDATPRSVQQQVDALIGQVEQARLQAQPETPTTAQIARLVAACAQLDPIAWAVERKRIKAICGAEVRLMDLDRLYTQAQKEARKATDTVAALSTERYGIEDGCLIYERVSERGMTRQTVAGWSGRIVEWITAVEDDGQTEHRIHLELHHSGKTVHLEAPAELFGDTNALTRFIAGRAGGLYTVRAGMNKHLVPALLGVSGEPVHRTTYCFIGWTTVAGRWQYVSPTLSITAHGPLNDAPTVALGNRLRDYGLSDTAWDGSLQAFTAVRDVLPTDLAPALLTFAMLPIVQRFFPAAAPRPAVHLVGTTGSGKSEIAGLLTSFYGTFNRDTPPSQWGDTVNTVETLGYPLADALYWVDDYKTGYADERSFTRFLQSYSRGMGRGRLTREAQLRQERPCRGLLLSTGEATIEGEASVLARMLTLEIPPWERRDPGGRQLAQAEMRRDALAGFTAHFAIWVASRADAGTLTKQIASDFERSLQAYRDRLRMNGEPGGSSGRMIQNWAVLHTVYQLLAAFLADQDALHALPAWADVLGQTVRAVQHERVGDLFLNTIAELLASGAAVLETDTRSAEAGRPPVPIIGYVAETGILLLPEVAYREACRIKPFKFSAAAIGAQLKEAGWLLPGLTTLTVQRRLRGVATRVWQLRAEFLAEGTFDPL